MFVSSYAHAASAAGDKQTGKRRYKSVPPAARSPTTKTAGTDIGMQRPQSWVTNNLKVSNMRAIRLSYCCLVRTAMGRGMFDQGWGCIILESTVMTFAPNQMLPVYYIHYDNRPANSTSPGSLPHVPMVACFCDRSPIVSDGAMTHCQHHACPHLNPTTFRSNVSQFVAV